MSFPSPWRFFPRCCRCSCCHFAIRRIGSGSASLIGTIGPVSTIYMAYAILGESISLLQIVGSSLVLVGVLIISLNSKRERKVIPGK